MIIDNSNKNGDRSVMIMIIIIIIMRERPQCFVVRLLSGSGSPGQRSDDSKTYAQSTY